jgi:hypothetical protein
MSVPEQLDNNKGTHGFLPGLWACFSRKFVYYWVFWNAIPSIEK